MWGLDDYQFLPFVWGSAQLVDHPFIKPGSIHSAEVLASYADEYLYLGAVAFVRQVKKGPLQETSPMLNDISGLPTWRKVKRGGGHELCFSADAGHQSGALKVRCRAR